MSLPVVAGREALQSYDDARLHEAKIEERGQ